MTELKNAWKQTAKSFVLALNDLSISLCTTVKVGVDKAVEWARTDNVHVQTEGVEVPAADPAETPAASAESTETPTE